MERWANALSTIIKKDLGVVTPVATAEKERDSFFCQDSYFSLQMHRASSCLGLLGVSAFFFIIIFNLINFFSIPYTFLKDYAAQYNTNCSTNSFWLTLNI